MKVFVVQRKLCYNGQMESQYYIPKVGNKGGRATTKNMYAFRYSKYDVLSTNHIKKKKTGIEGNNTLSVCKSCLDLNAQLPASIGYTYKSQKKDWRILTNKIQL